jgi:hypothetical protein
MRQQSLDEAPYSSTISNTCNYMELALMTYFGNDKFADASHS